MPIKFYQEINLKTPRALDITIIITIAIAIAIDPRHL
jgi:hypothetical protein